MVSKKILKLSAVAGSLLLVLGTASPVFAADDAYTITLTTQGRPSYDYDAGKALADAHYNIYKVFDMTYSGDKAVYTIESDSPFFDDVWDSTNKKGINGFDLYKAAGTDKTYVVTKNSAFNAATFADVIKADTSKGTAAATATFKAGTGSGNKLSVNVPSAGYYVVIGDVNGGLAALDSAHPSADIVLKDTDVSDYFNGSVTNPYTTSEDKGADYTITGVIPSNTGYSGYTYKVSIDDPAATSLTYNGKTTVKIADIAKTVDLNDADNDGVGYSIDGNKLVIDFDVPQLNSNEDGTKTSALAGKTFEIKGHVDNTPTTDSTGTTVEKATGKTLAKGHPVHFALTYENNTTAAMKDPANNTATKNDTSYTYSFDVKVDKYDSKSETTKLAGAKFVLRNAAGKYFKNDKNVSNTNGTTWVDSIKDATVVTTNSTGSATFYGLDPEDLPSGADSKDITTATQYYLVETESPAGYNLLKDPVPVSLAIQSRFVSSDGEKDYYNPTYGTTYKVANVSGTVLPASGGTGTIVATAVGCVGAAAVVIYFATRNKKSENKAD